MPLQFILGPSYADKEEAIVEDIAKQMADHPNQTIYYLVPDHMKFESELNILNRLEDYPAFADQDYMGMINLQVLSFSRLAWYILQDQPVYQKNSLTDAGLAMLVQRILIENKDRLTLFQGEVYQYGFVQKLLDLFKEFHKGQISLEDLTHLVDQPADDIREASFQNKMDELSLIYEAYEDALQDKYIEQEDILDELIQYIEDHDMSGVSIYINHFSSFTAQEQSLILSLVHHCNKVTVGLNLDRPYYDKKPSYDQVFYQTGTIYYRLYQACRRQELPVMADRTLGQNQYLVHSSLQSLEKLARQSPLHSYAEPMQVEGEGRIQVWKAASRQAELVHLTHHIRRLVSEESFRYRDILVLTRNIEDYAQVAPAFFNKNGLPLFLDRSKSMINHPLVHFLQLLLNVHRYHWQSDHVLALLRTELLLPVDENRSGRLASSKLLTDTADLRNKVDHLENYVLKYGIQSYEWTIEGDWQFAGDMATDEEVASQTMANEMKAFLNARLIPLFKQLDQAETSQTAARALYLFLERQAVPELLLAWRDQKIEEGQLEEAREYEQVWRVLISILDEYVDVLGQGEWQLEAFIQILQAGFENASYANVPPAIDQVVMTSLTSLPPDKSKMVFVLGLNDGALPKTPSNDTLLSDQDRERIDQETDDEVFLMQAGQDFLSREFLVAYEGLTQATEGIFLSYLARDEDNKELKASPYIDRILTSYQLEAQEKFDEARHNFEEDQGDFVGSKSATAGQLLGVIREGLDQGSQPGLLWLNLYQYLSKDFPQVFNQLLPSLTYQNTPVQLKTGLPQQLYGNDLYLSVSQLESYYRDPYSHFLQYGLRLKERSRLDLTALETGSFFHDTLDLVVKKIQDQEIDLAQLSSSDIKNIVQSVVDDLMTLPDYMIFGKSGRMNFLKDQLSQVVGRMLWAMKNQKKYNPFRPVATELSFGLDQKQWGSLAYPLSQGGQIFLRGKIDRIDRLDHEGKHYFNVIDYKSGSKKVDEKEIYYGLSIQLLTYLNLVLKHAQKDYGSSAQAGGAFYSQISNPYLSLKEDLPALEITENQVVAHTYEGFLIEDEALFSLLAEPVEPTSKSWAYPLKRLKKGDIRVTDTYSQSDLELLLDYTDYLIQQAGDAMMAGQIPLRPYEGISFTPSVSGPYRSISQFDALLPENNYLPLLDKSLEDIRNVLEEGGYYDESDSNETR